ncbi:MAG: hypothetical protein IPM57_08880 [Oligoflexia bacterium]|nr:hypothetical protein [Oligoflexia bacterium]
MSRQLNPALFGEFSNNPTPSGVIDSFVTSHFSLLEESPLLLEMIEKLKKQIEDSNFLNQENSKNTALRMEKLINRLQLHDERLNMLQKEQHEKFSDLNQKVREKSLNETKIESLIERHNQIVQSFELRISQAQKLIDNQSLQLAKQQELIDDARRQIEKLKKL